MSCWYESADTYASCDALRASTDCYTVQLLLRWLLLVGSNIVFLIPCLLLVLRRRSQRMTLNTTDHLFIIAQVAIFICSSSYHSCEKTYVLCGSYCLADFPLVLYADELMAGASVLSGASLDWMIECEPHAQLCLLISYVLYPAIGLYMLSPGNDDWVFALFVVIMSGLIWFYRWWVDEDLAFTRLGEVLLLLVLPFGAIALLLQYTNVIGGPKAMDHAAWHIGSGIANCATPFIYRRPRHRKRFTLLCNEDTETGVENEKEALLPEGKALKERILWILRR